jgi:hypothetical protein
LLPFNGLDAGLHSLYRLSGAVTRSISAENPTGAKGQGGMATDGPFAGPARELGPGWKVSPFLQVPARSTVTLADIAGPGALQHLWNTTQPQWWRRLILRFFWDDEPAPSIETPLGDLFCSGWCVRATLSSLPVAVMPAGGLNCFWPMPFRRRARVTLENLWDEPCPIYAYQLTYALAPVPDDAAYLHAQFRRSNPLPEKEVHTVLDGVRGRGHYVGTYLAIQPNANGWWGEGEIKFYLDGDADYATIVGTGTEDYFGGAWNFEDPSGQYGVLSTPYMGLHQVVKPDGLYIANGRFGMYRWHIPDPIRFEHDLRVTLQALGWRSGRRFLPLRADMATTAFWYQAEPHAPFPALPDRDGLEVTTGPASSPRG